MTYSCSYPSVLLSAQQTVVGCFKPVSSICPVALESFLQSFLITGHKLDRASVNVASVPQILSNMTQFSSTTAFETFWSSLDLLETFLALGTSGDQWYLGTEFCDAPSLATVRVERYPLTPG